MAAYDSYNYPAYWKDRAYEHESELVALNNFIRKIPSPFKIADIGCGFGRLISSYKTQAKAIYLIDPSTKLLKLAKKKLANCSGIKSIHSQIENLDNKIKPNSLDVALIVRVVHHIKDINKALSVLSKKIKKNGYLILEYPNKMHCKALVKNFFQGNFTFPMEITSIDKRCQKNKKKKTLPFLNYHPETIRKALKNNNFKILEIRSVSNFRYPFLKRYIPKSILLGFERILQRPLGTLQFGPSIFILAQKRG